MTLEESEQILEEILAEFGESIPSLSDYVDELILIQNLITNLAFGSHYKIFAPLTT